MRIKDIKLRVIYNVLGDQTIEAIINNKFMASAPSGTSRGAYEAKTQPIETAISHFNRTKEEFIGTFTQKSFDSKLKEHVDYLGANTTTSLSLAFFSPTELKNTFPNLLGNVLGGGMHTKIATRMNIQEILTIPNAPSIPKAIDTNIKIWKEVGKKLPHAKQNIESAWSGDVTNEEALELVSGIAQKYNAFVGIDVEASGFYKDGKYIYWNRELSRQRQIKYMAGLAKEFNLVYIEDGIEQNDFEGFALLRKKLKKTLVCGDDLTVTNPERLKTAIADKSINAIIIKPNQIGTITDAIETMEIAKKHKIVPVVSHRSGETKDVTICKLAQLAPLAKLGVAGNRKPKLDELRRMWFDVKNPKMTKLPF